MTIKLFGTDGIRSKFGKKPLTTDILKLIGYAFAKSMFNNDSGHIYISHDGRESCSSIEGDLISGISFQGSSYTLLGLFPTPALSASMHQMKKKDTCAIQITASHNQYDDNGLKFFDYRGNKINDSIQRQIENIVYSESFDIKSIKRHNNIDKDFSDIYVSFIREYFSTKLSNSLPYNQKLNILVDCANGAFSEIIDCIFDNQYLNIIPINIKPDGKNINLNCGATNPKQISDFINFFNSQKVKSSKSKSETLKIDLGIAIDGDGDRAIFADDHGNILDGDDIIFLLATNNMKSTMRVVGTLMTNYGIRKAYEDAGIDFIETDVGDIHVANKMRECDCTLGGESSGHIIFNDFKDFFYGDSMITLINVVKLLLESKKSLSEHYQQVSKIPSELINIEVNDKSNFLTNEKNINVISYMKEQIGSNGRLLVRPSGTENLVRFLIEHKDTREINVLKIYLYANIEA
tara:strand:- start:1142 stop:2530 length:1389 start_codon:yes stop_codon:yes gene_type:complete